MPKYPRSDHVGPYFLNPIPQERHWIRTIPDIYPDIMRAPAVLYKPDRDLARIQANTYVVFARPYRGKQGLLLIGPAHRPMIIEESQPNDPQVLPMRLDRDTIQGAWIFAITLYGSEGLVQLEDCIVADGKQIRTTKPFSERFGLLQKFTNRVWFNDTRFQLGWQIQVATIHSLSNIRTVVNSQQNSGSICLMPELASLRLIKVLPQEIAHEVFSGPTEYICIPIEGKPDVYDLKGGTKIVGRASIQTLSISQALQQKRATGQPLRVMAEWNEEFESHVVTSVL